MDSFSSRLRFLRKTKKISQKELASMLGLAQTTIANYEQGIRFPDERLLHMLADYFQVSLDYLMGRTEIQVSENNWFKTLKYKNEDSSQENLELITNEYMNLVLSGEKQLASRFILGKVKDSVSVKDIYIHVLEKSLKKIGDLWELGKLDVAAEHHFTHVTKTILSQLQPYLFNSKQLPYTVVSMSVSGELHNVGIHMVTDFLEMEGFNAIFLGSNLPTNSVLKTLKYWKADVLAISATMDYHINAAETLIAAVKADENTKNIKIMVGGAAFNNSLELWKKIGADAYSSNAEDAVNVIKGLVR